MNTEILRPHVLPKRDITSRPRVVIHVPTASSQTGDSIRNGGDTECDGERRKKVASMVRVNRVRPRPRFATATSSLLLRAVADARKSLLNTPLTKTDKELQKTDMQVSEDSSQEQGDSISLCEDMDIGDDKSKNNMNSPSVSNDESTQFTVVTDDFHPNAFLIKKPRRRLSNSSDESDIEVIINNEDVRPDKRKRSDEELPVAKKRKASSPIVFDVEKKSKVTETSRERTDSAPPLSLTERKLEWCRMFPACRYGSACAHPHPRCKFLAACKRPNCFYSHSPNAPSTPSVAPRVLPAAKYKSISAVVPMCKFYPNCMNPACHFYHPKPCRLGKNCANKQMCNFYHADVPKWRYYINNKYRCVTQSKYKTINKL